MSAKSKSQNNSKRPKAGFSLSIHPLMILASVFLLAFIVMGWWGGAGTSSVYQISVDQLLNGIKQNEYSRIDIRNTGEILAQAKYIYIASVSEETQIEYPESITKAYSQSDLGEKTLADIVEMLKPQDPLVQLRAGLGIGGNPDRIKEIVFTESEAIVITTKSAFLVPALSHDQLDQALLDSGLDTAGLNIIISATTVAAEAISLDSLQARLNSGLVAQVFQIGDLVYARLVDSKIPTYALNWDVTVTSFARTLQEEGISLASQNFIIDSIIVSSVPWGDVISILTLIGFLILGFFLFRGIQSSGSSLSRFGQSRARMFWGQQQDVTFDDVAGIDEAREELSEIVQFLRTPDKFRKLGARIPKGVLMVGAPGTGKTLLARAIAGEAKVPFFHTSGSEFEEMLVGAGASRVRDLFEKAKKAAPSLIFIDEIDAVARKRGTTIQSSTTEQTLNQILVEMDGFEQNLDVIIIAATNRPDVLDPAILRPGRFDRRVVLELPDAEGRKKILAIHAKNKPLAPGLDFDRLAKRTIGFSGAELENTLNEAAIIAAKANKHHIEYSDIEEAASKVMMGPAKVSRKRDDYTLKLVAYHEAGHAVVSKFTPQANLVHRVSIISRGNSGGVTEFLPADENSITSRTKLLSQLTMSLGGRAAEELFMGDVSTGASGDITQATNIARNMVQKFGMSEKLGLIKYGDSMDLEHLGYGYGENKDYSEETAKLIDDEVRKLMSNAYAQAKEILQKNQATVDKLVEMLLEKEVVESDEFDKLFTQDKD
jgi:cell division protease FtsH